MTDDPSPERQGSLPDGEGLPGLLAECVATARSAVSSLHPRRLVIGLLAVLVIVQIGSLHDRVAGPRFGPGGLLADDPEADREAAVARWRTRLAVERPETDLPDADPLRREAIGAAFDAETASPWELLEEARRRLVERGGSEGDAADGDLERFLELLEDRPRGTFECVVQTVGGAFGEFCRGVVTADPRRAVEQLAAIVVEVPSAIWRHDRMFLLSVGLPSVLLSCLLGGMLARMAACRFARRQWLTLAESADFAFASWRRLLSAPLLPLAAALVPLGVVALLGLLLAIPIVELLAGALFGVPMILGLVSAILLLGLAVGWPLIVPAVACEDADAADCLQRAYAYSFNRFGRLLVLFAAALVGLAIAAAVLDAVVLATFGVVRLAISETAPDWVGTLLGDRAWLRFGERPSPAGVAGDGWTADAVATWITLARMLVGALVFAWIFDAGVRIHLFLRRAVDRIRPEEIAESPGRPPRPERIREAIEAARRAE